MRAPEKKWTAAERQIFFRVYPDEGYRGVQKLLPHRKEGSIKAFALRCSVKVTRAPKPETVARRHGSDLSRRTAAPVPDFGLHMFKNDSLTENRVVVRKDGRVIAMADVQCLVIIAGALTMADDVVMHPSAAPAFREWMRRDRRARAERTESFERVRRQH
jgi:hypothetical protein